MPRSPDSPVAEWQALLARSPDAVAVASPGATFTVAELLDETRAAAAALTAAGLGPGGRAVVALPASFEFVAVVLAVRLLGAVLVNAPWQWRRELVSVVEETDPTVVLVPEEQLRDEALAPIASRVVSVAGASPPAAALEPVKRKLGDVAWLAYTSGSTGRPKGAVHTEATFAEIPAGFIRHYGLGPEDTVLVTAPVGHAVGLIYGVQLALRAGCPMVLMPRWDAGRAADLVSRHRCTFTVGPTPFLADLVDHAERHGSDALGSLRWFCCGGATVPSALLRRARSALPATFSLAYYGSSEGGGVTASRPDDPEEKTLTRDGYPLPGMEIAVDDGELLVRGSQLARGYWAGDTEQRFRSDGWFRTGDRAAIDEDGWLRLEGRRDELIRRGGVSVAPAEVEEVLAAHPDVSDVVVVGVPDDRLGERVGAVVVSAGRAPTAEDLREWCRRAGLAKVKWPELVQVRPSIDRGPSGKVRRDAVRRALTGTPA